MALCVVSFKPVTIGIYAILHTNSRKRYIGKSKNIERRFSEHRASLLKKERDKSTNRYLWAAVQKYGIEAFEFEIIESFESFDEALIGERELYWMDYFDSCVGAGGYNLRRDTSTGMVMHKDTLAMKSVFSLGVANPNYGNAWSDEQKLRMSENAKQRHRDGVGYDDKWRKKISAASKKLWSDEAKKQQMAKKVSRIKERYHFEQYSTDGVFIRLWPSVKAIVAENPTYKWQNIYSVCNGYKPTYMGFVWKKVPKDRA